MADVDDGSKDGSCRWIAHCTRARVAGIIERTFIRSRQCVSTDLGLAYYMHALITATFTRRSYRSLNKLFL